MRHVLLLIILSGMIAPILPQEAVDISDLLEGLESEAIGQTDFWQVLSDLSEQPLNINAASVSELLAIPFFDERIAQNIVRHRRENGQFADVTVLLEIDGFSEELLTAIRPYIRLDNPPNLPVVEYRSRAAGLLHLRRGDTDGRYSDRWQVYQRLRWRPHPRLLTTAIWEKDAAEPEWFDFGSFSLGYDWQKAKSYLIAGDFNLESGQGLVFNSAYGTPLVADNFLPYRANMLRWRSKSAVDENAFLRGGLWAFVPAERLQVLLFFANQRIDATVDDATNTVTSLYTSGLHRTKTEAQKRDRLGEQTIGVGLQFSGSGWLAGALATAQSYSLPIEQGGRLEDRYRYLSGFWQMQRSLLTVGGEAALLNGKFPAIQQSLLIKLPEPRLLYGLLFYYYHPEFWSRHGRALGSISQSPGNETGLAMNASLKVWEKTRLSGYLWVNRTARDFSEAPNRRHAQQVQILQQIGKSQLLLRYTRRLRWESGEAAPEKNRTHAWRVQLRNQLSSKLRLTQRLELRKGRPLAEATRHYGFALYHDVQYFPRPNIHLQARWTHFDVSDFEYAIYEFENDLPGSFRNVLLNDRGEKWFILFSYDAWQKWRFSVKYQEIVYPDLQNLGSGIDQVLGNRKQTLRVQLQFKY